jgi:trimeric autotransporter adhesin
MKKIYQILTILLCIYVQTADAQMGVNSSGADPAPSSILDVSSTTKGLLIPRMTSTQRDAIVSPANGLMIYTTNVGEIQVYDGGVESSQQIKRTIINVWKYCYRSCPRV